MLFIFPDLDCQLWPTGGSFFSVFFGFLFDRLVGFFLLWVVDLLEVQCFSFRFSASVAQWTHSLWSALVDTVRETASACLGEWRFHVLHEEKWTRI